MLTICDKIENFAEVIAIAEAHEDIYASVGAHPHYAKDHPGLAAATLIALGGHEKVAGVGETGLICTTNSARSRIKSRFFAFTREAARKLDKTLIIHTRASRCGDGAIVGGSGGEGPLRILMHCYTLRRRAGAARPQNRRLFFVFRHLDVQERR